MTGFTAGVQSLACVRPNLRLGLPALVLLSLALAACTAPTNATVELAQADGFAILAGAGITNIGSTTVAGDVGSHPTPAQTGFGPGADSVTLTPPSANQFDGPATQSAKSALVTAYNDAQGRTGGIPVAGGDLGGLILTPGVYTDSDAPDSLAITGTLTLNGLDDPNSVFIFQSGSTLVTASGSKVVLTRGAQACNIFWQATSSATLGTDSHLEGTILALTSITLDTGATIDGRALARNGAVTLHNNTIQRVPCDGTTPTPTPTTTTPAIPVFPTTTAMLVACAGAVGAAFLILRRRR